MMSILDINIKRIKEVVLEILELRRNRFERFDSNASRRIYKGITTIYTVQNDVLWNLSYSFRQVWSGNCWWL